MSVVRSSAQYIMQNAETVTIDFAALDRMAEGLRDKAIEPWDKFTYHYTGPNVIDYVFALDAVNFCFWPRPGFEYEHMATNLKTRIEADPNSLKPEVLANITLSEVEALFEPGFPLISERHRLLQEIGRVTRDSFNSRYESILEQAGGSAIRLVELIAANFPGFRDSCIYKGRQVFFYKRAQILVADLWAVYEGAGLAQFTDMRDLTMFPDYRIPQLLRGEGVIDFPDEELLYASPVECEIRAASVIACDRLAMALGLENAVHCDWLLWQLGEDRKDELPPHHKTLSIFY